MSEELRRGTGEGSTHQEFLAMLQVIEDNGTTLVEIARSRVGGGRDYVLIDDPLELAKLIDEAPPSAKFRIVAAFDAPFGEPYYKAPGPGVY